MTPPTRLAPGPVDFDSVRELWRVTRYAEVKRALGDPRLGIAGGSEPSARGALARAAARTGDALSPSMMRATAQEYIDGMPKSGPADWVGDFARPWSLGLVQRVGEIAGGELHALDRLAGITFDAAARAVHPHPSPTYRDAVVALARALPGTIEPQAFVALAHSLPALLGNAWAVLIQDADLWDRLRVESAIPAGVTDELLRLGNPTEVVFREARADLPLGEEVIPAGSIVALGLGAAHRDPAAYPNPDQVRLRESAPSPLTFGAGRHGCPGAALICRALTTATAALVETYGRAEPAGQETYGGGFALQFVTNLPVSTGRPGASKTTCTGR